MDGGAWRAAVPRDHKRDMMTTELATCCIGEPEACLSSCVWGQALAPVPGIQKAMLEVIRATFLLKHPVILAFHKIQWMFLTIKAKISLESKHEYSILPFRKDEAHCYSTDGWSKEGQLVASGHFQNRARGGRAIHLK